MSQLFVDWFAEDREVTTVTLHILSPDAIQDRALECPILLQPFVTADMAELPGAKYLIDNREFCMAILPCCMQSIHPLALAVHWMLHSMRCPFCKQGTDSPLSELCLPSSCRSKVRAYVDKIRSEMNQEIANEDVRHILDSMEDTELDSSFALELVLLRQWPFVYPRMQLQVTLHIPLATVHTALELVNPTETRGRESVWNPCPHGIGLFCPLVESSCDDIVSHMGTQLNHIRRITKAIQALKPGHVSMSLCYSSSAFIWQVVRMPMIQISENLHDSSQQLYYVHNDQRVDIGKASICWIKEATPQANPHKRSIDRILVEVDTHALMDRLVYGHMCLYNLQGTEDTGMRMQNGVLRFAIPNM